MAEDSMPQNQDEAEISDTVDCDNHPGRPAVLTTDLDGAIQPINLCEECVPPTLQGYVGK